MPKTAEEVTSLNPSVKLQTKRPSVISLFSGEGRFEALDKANLLVPPSCTKLTRYVSSSKYSASLLFLVCSGVPAASNQKIGYSQYLA